MTLVIVCFCFCLFIFLKIFFIWGSFVFALSETHCSAVEHVVVTVVVVGVGESEAGFSVGGCAKFLRNSKALPGIFGEGLATRANGLVASTNSLRPCPLWGCSEQVRVPRTLSLSMRLLQLDHCY